MIKKWDDWGAALTFVLGPLGWIIDLVMEFIDRWDNITQAFEQGGVLKGIKEIGKVLLSALIKPFEAFLRLLAKIPFLADKLQPAIDKLNNFREGMFTDPNKPILVNPDAANTEAQATVMNEWKGRLNVGVKADAGTTATVQQANGVTPTVSNTSTFKRNNKMDIQDILIYESGDGGEMKLKNDDLETVSSITNGFYLALFSSKTPDWWGNSELLADNPFSSTFEKTLDSVSLNSSGLKQLEQSALEDLSFLKQYGEISVFAAVLDLNKISLKINFKEPSGSEKIVKFVFDKLRNEIIEEVTI